MVQNSRDVLTALGMHLEVLDDPLTPPAGERPDNRESDGLARHLSDTLPLTAEDVARKLRLPFAEVLSRLTALELGGSVRRFGDGYVREPRKAVMAR
jgi:predicted Rossmann fold nucleotide-binding protein DprA/Smf involved in DNA uptake